MKVYEDYANEILDKKVFIDILKFIQNIVFRRFLCDLPTSSLNKIFETLYHSLDQENFLESLQKQILRKSGDARFPKDEELKDALTMKELYNVKEHNKKYFFEKIENQTIDPNLNIERIFPEKPDKKWITKLGTDEVKNIKSEFLNTVFNLAISSNKGVKIHQYFSQKKEGYTNRFWFNRFVISKEEWNYELIEERVEQITERVLNIWKYPAVDMSELEEGEKDIFHIPILTRKKIEYFKFMDDKKHFQYSKPSEMYLYVLKELFDFEKDKFLYEEKLLKKFKIEKNNKNEFRKPMQLREQHFYIEGQLSNSDILSRLKFVLKYLKMRGMLFLKLQQE